MLYVIWLTIFLKSSFASKFYRYPLVKVKLQHAWDQRHCLYIANTRATYTNGAYIHVAYTYVAYTYAAYIYAAYIYAAYTCSIPIETKSWRSTLHRGVKAFGYQRRFKRDENRAACKANQGCCTPTADQSGTCPHCDKISRSRIGLTSHLRVH